MGEIKDEFTPCPHCFKTYILILVVYDKTCQTENAGIVPPYVWVRYMVDFSPGELVWWPFTIYNCQVCVAPNHITEMDGLNLGYGCNSEEDDDSWGVSSGLKDLQLEGRSGILWEQLSADFEAMEEHMMMNIS